MAKLEFEIEQINPATEKRPELVTKFKVVISSRYELTRQFVLLQIKSRVAKLLLMRVKTKQSCGLTLSRPINIRVKIGKRFIETAEISEEIHLQLKMANNRERQNAFYRALDEIVDYAINGKKAATRDEFDAMNESRISIIEQEKQARLERKAAALAQMATSQN